MKVIGYVRVSTDKQVAEGCSLEAQQAKLRAFAVAMDLELVGIEIDAGVSAKSLDRPALQRALAALREQRAAGLLVVKLDRLTRSVKDLGHLLEDYFGERSGRSLLSVSDSIDTRTAAGRLVLNVLMSVAQWEREATGERVRETMAHLKAQGVHCGRAPLGRRHAEATDAEGRRLLVEDPEGRVLVERIRALHMEGLGVRAIADRLEADGIRTARGGAKWHPTVVHRILRRSAA
jgi:DNA invertase Pin-like site-specific DNA recombinase